MTLKQGLRNSATIDHVVPQSVGGSHHSENLEIACALCNGIKGMLPVETFVRYRMWEIRKGKQMKLLRAQLRAIETGDIDTLREMGAICFNKGL